VSRHVTFFEEKFKSTEIVEGLVPEEDYDPDVSEDDYDVIIEQRRVRVHEDPFLPAEDREAQPRKPELVENVGEDEVSNNAAEPSQEEAGRIVLTFPPDWIHFRKWDEQPLFDFPDTQEKGPDNETDRSTDANAGFSESSLREAEGTDDEEASAPDNSEDNFSARDETGEANPVHL
jgi:hypothetical protein